MTYSEFTEKMKKLGWDDDWVNYCIKKCDKALKEGFDYPLEVHLFECPPKPISN